MTETPSFDVAILGGGPAGSTAATLLAREELQCVLLESEKFPRPHVGESLVPATTPVLKELGVLEKIIEAGFVKKHGAAWTSSGPFTADDQVRVGQRKLLFAKVAIRETVAADAPLQHTFHVDRARFDEILLRHAESEGVEVREETRASRVDFSDPERVVIQADSPGGPCSFSARMIVDATGRRTLLGNQFQLKSRDPLFNQYAIHSWFEGLDRNDRATEGYVVTYFLPMKHTWVWQIPISESVTSVGVVTHRNNLRSAEGSQEEFFWDAVSGNPTLYDNLRKSTRMRPLQTEGDYSYSMSRIVGDRFVLVGDAARFVDPIFSSGVSVALKSAQFAARDIVDAFRRKNLNAESFSRYEKTMRSGCENWYEFIRLYYRLNVLFTYFVNKSKYRADLLRLIAGDVWEDKEPDILRRMREIVERVEADPGHIWHGMLGGLSAEAARPKF